MGAAASVRMLYKDALAWFKQYIDTETYMDDFKAMDRHNENALSFADVRDWMVDKSKNDPSWGIFLTSGPVLAVAHRNACKHHHSASNASVSKMVDVTDFRALLVHLFAISILWSHFQNADEWEQSGGEIGNRQLNFEAFKLACRTLTSSNAKEELTDHQIKLDFEMLDGNQSRTVGFFEVCNYCCKYIDDPDVQKQVLLPKFFGEKKIIFVTDDLMTGLEAGPKTYFENASIEEKNHEMILALANKLASQSDALKFATAYEHKNNIKKKYFTIDELLQHPICLSYLMKFCKIQHNSENLSFLTDVDEYREIFNGDDNSCWKNWRDTDTRVSIDLDIDEKYLENQWISKACKKQALDKINDIFKKYFHSDSVSQASISNNVLDKTKKRIQLISLYGAAVFEEASIDPLITLERDVLPRFRNSTCCHDMIISLSFCEPPPPAASLEVLPPGNILLHISSLDSFSEHRRFSLEEVIGTQSLFYGFFKYLKDEKSVGINKLICIRNIDTFYQLMNINCYEEAFEIAWIIFRYFVVSGSVYQIDIPSTELKMIMLQLADPQKEIFDFVRVTALASLRADFEQFMKTSIYVDYPLMMREMKLALEPRDKCQSMTSLKWLRCDK